MSGRVEREPIPLRLYRVRIRQTTRLQPYLRRQNLDELRGLPLMVFLVIWSVMMLPLR